MLKEILRLTFRQRKALYCYLIMTVWILFILVATYKYITIRSSYINVKEIPMRKSSMKSDIEFRRLYLETCNPPDSIIRGSEGAADGGRWSLVGALAVTRHGDRGPLEHLRGGDALPCDARPPADLLRSYEEFVRNATSGAARGPWAAAGPFHAFPSLPRAAAPAHCPLGQLTPVGVLQLLRVGGIFKTAYADKLKLDNLNTTAKRDSEDVQTYSTKYRRTYQSLLAALYGLSAAHMPRRAALARAAHAVHYCFAHCACPAARQYERKVNQLEKKLLDAHPRIKWLLSRVAGAVFPAGAARGGDAVRDALLAHVCHDAPLPCAPAAPRAPRAPRVPRAPRPGARRRRRAPDQLDFDAQMEREKLHYYQQRYPDYDYDAAGDSDDEAAAAPTAARDGFCVTRRHATALLAYLDWSRRRALRSRPAARRARLAAYGLLHSVGRHLVRVMSHGAPKFVLFSGHDKTLGPLMVTLGLGESVAYVPYGSRLVFELYRRVGEPAAEIVASDFFFRVVYNGADVTREISVCAEGRGGERDAETGEGGRWFMCPIENIIRFIHDDYFAMFDVSNYRDACNRQAPKRNVG